MEELAGRSLPELARALHFLSHPEVLPLTKAWVISVDVENRCLNYEAPWNCVREAEAHYENIQYGWTGGVGIGYSGNHWCDNCRKRVMEG